MRILAWLGLGLLLLLGAVGLVADLVVTRMVNRDPLRTQIDELVEEALGRDVGWGKLGVGLFPPSLVVEQATIAGAAAEAESLVEAEKIELRVALTPLLARAVVIDSLFVQQATVRLILTKEGIELPDFGGGKRAEAADEPDEEGAPTAVAIRRVELEDARLVFEDRRASPFRVVDLVDVDVRLEGAILSEEFAVDVSIEPKGGGLATLSGTAGLDQDLDLTLEVKDFPLVLLDPYLGVADEVRGSATGTGTVQGPIAAPTQVVIDVEVADALLRFQETRVEGPLSMQVEHSGPWESPKGRFRIDATRARASLAGVYEKAPGRPATITGRLVSKEGVIGLDDVELKIENVDARGRVDFGKRNHVSMRVDPIEIGHWQPLLKPLADFEMSGRISSDRWEVWTAPVAMKGRMAFERVRVTGPKGRDFSFDGRVVAGDGVVRTEGLVLEAAEHRLPVEVEITDLAGDWRYRIRTAGEQMDSNLLLSSVAGRPDTLYGPLDLDADLTGTLVGEASFLQALGGRTRFRISPGKLKGISILEATLKQFDKMRGGGLLGGLLLPRGGLAPAMSDHYKDDFTLLSANLSLGRGVASTQDLRLVTEGYEFTMQGAIGLEDLGLDARGEIKLGEELTRSIAQSVGLKQMPLMQAWVIPIPRLRGTVSDPRPEPDFSFLLRALTGNLPGVKGIQKLLEGLDGTRQQPTRQP